MFFVTLLLPAFPLSPPHLKVCCQHVVVLLHDHVDHLLAPLGRLGLHVLRDLNLVKLGTQLLT